MEGFPQVCFIKNFCTNPNVVIGDYTYYDDPDGPQRFFENILYHFDFIGDKLIIGRYCSIARKTTFIMNGGSHALGSFSSYPFFIFGSGWEAGEPESHLSPPVKDTRIDNDVWIGYNATILPGVHIGHGCVVGADGATPATITSNTTDGGGVVVASAVDYVKTGGSLSISLDQG